MNRIAFLAVLMMFITDAGADHIAGWHLDLTEVIEEAQP